MGTRTTNYNMTKPDNTDLIDVSVLNANFDIIDQKMKEAMDMAEASITATPARSLVNLTTTWEGSGPYTQTVTISNAIVTSESRVDLQPNSTVLNQMISDGVKALWIENNNGVLTAYALGAAPTVALTIQCMVSTTGTSLVSIAVTTQPTKTNYAVGNTLDLTGLVITATYADGNTSVVTNNCTFSIPDGGVLTEEGNRTIEVSYLYNGITKNTAFYITVVAAVESISVTTNPTKTAYILGDDLDLTGIVVTATYTDATTADVTANCTFDPDDGDELSVAGEQSISISYTENEITKTTSFNVTVESVTLVSIAVTTQPTTTTYTQGDTLDFTGLVVTATYDNQFTTDVTSGCVFSPQEGETLSYVGENVISVAYAENGTTTVTSFSVTVNASE